MGCGFTRPEKPEDPLCAHCRKENGVRMYFGSKYCGDCFEQLQSGHEKKRYQLEEQLAKARGEEGYSGGGGGGVGVGYEGEKKIKKKGKEKIKHEEEQPPPADDNNEEVQEESTKKKKPPPPPPKKRKKKAEDN